jgi:hypothetical protein
MGIYSIRVLIWSKTRTHGYVNGAKPSPIGYVGTGTAGVAGPIPVYPWVKNTRPKIKPKIKELLWCYVIGGCNRNYYATILSFFVLEVMVACDL